MQVVYAMQEFPEAWDKSIFLAGPTPRGDDATSWRPEALECLQAYGYDGVVFVPEASHGEWAKNYVDQASWERQGMEMSDGVVFWVPRDLETMPALTTNVEFGKYVDSGKVFYGRPPDAPKNRYLDWLFKEFPQVGIVRDTLSDTCMDVSQWLHDQSHWRSGGERCVPLYVWNTPGFQHWYTALQAAGNRLDEAQVLWTFRRPKMKYPFSHILKTKVWVESEKRHKDNEWVFTRTDISTVVLYRRPPNLENPELDYILDTEIVLIREFRSPARTPDGFIHELPGGSSMKGKEDPRTIASDEVREETGLVLAPDRFQALGSRQVTGTLSSHHAHVYMAQLTPQEMAEAKKKAALGTHFGLEEDTERTYVEVCTVADLVGKELVDWSTLGMVMKAVSTVTS